MKQSFVKNEIRKNTAPGSKSAKTKDGRRFLWIYLVAWTFALMLSYYAFQDEYRMNRGTSYLQVTENWTYRNGGKVSLEVPVTEPIFRVVPASDAERTLFMEVQFLKFRVLVGDKEVYVTPSSRALFSGKAPGSYVAEMTIPATDKPVRISVFPMQDDVGYNGYITKIYIGNGHDIATAYLRDKSFDRTIGLSVMVTGLILLLLFIVLRTQGVTLNVALYFAIFIFNFGVYQIMDTGLVSYKFGELYFANTIARLAVTCVPVPLLLFLKEIYTDEQKKVLNIGIIVGLINLVQATLGQLTGIRDLHQNSSTTRIVMLVLLTLATLASVRDFKYNGKQLILHFLGLFYFELMTATDVVFEMLGTNLYGMHARMGITVFFVMELIQILKLFTYQFEAAVKEQTYKDMAFMDALTGCESKYAFDAKVQEMRTLRPVVVAIYDVNGLKKVNDTYGHAAGNRLILALSGAMRTVFAELGSVYRIGGDEFAFLSNGGVTRADFMAAAERLQKTLNEINEQKTYEFEISAAYGFYVLSKEAIGVTVEDALEKADALMYENKKKHGSDR